MKITSGRLQDKGETNDNQTSLFTRLNSRIPLESSELIKAAILCNGSEGSGDSVVTKEEGMLKRATGSDSLRQQC